MLIANGPPVACTFTALVPLPSRSENAEPAPVPEKVNVLSPLPAENVTALTAPPTYPMVGSPGPPIAVPDTETVREKMSLESSIDKEVEPPPSVPAEEWATDTGPWMPFSVPSPTVTASFPLRPSIVVVPLECVASTCVTSLPIPLVIVTSLMSRSL